MADDKTNIVENLNESNIASFLQKKHPDYLKWLPVWKKMYCAYLGGAEFKKGFLWRFEGEDDNDWANRLQRSAYENLLLYIVDRRQGLVYNRRIVRESDTSKPKVLQAINRNMDNMGTPRDQFVKKVFRLMQVFGWLPILTDKPSEESITQQDQQDRQLYPYSIPILPFNFLNWAIDEQKELEWALIRGIAYVGDDPTKPIKVNEYRIVTKESIAVWREKPGKSNKNKYEEVAVVNHGLGRTPIVLLDDLEPEQASIVGRPSLLDSCDLSLKLFNQSSWYDQLVYKTNYATLAAHPFDDNSKEEPEIVSGPGYVMWVPPEEDMPEWISPDTAAADIFERKLADMRRRIYEQAELEGGFAEEGTRDISGKAHTFRAKPTENMAKRLAQDMEDFECELETMLMENWEKDNAYECKIFYPRTFGIVATADALADLQAVEDSTVLPQEVKGILASQIILTSSFIELSDKRMKELQEKIEGFDPAAEEMAKAKALEQIKVDAQKQLEVVKAQAQKDVVVQQGKVEAEKAAATPKDTSLFG